MKINLLTLSSLFVLFQFALSQSSTATTKTYICWRESHFRGVGAVPIKSHCGDKEYDLGLCYPKCKPGFSGIGAVCWAECPTSHPVICQSACTKTEEECKNGIKELIVSATTGAASTASASTKIALKNALKTVVEKLLQKFGKKSLKELKGQLSREFENTFSPNDAKLLEDVLTDPRFDFANFDPTVILQVVQAYKRPLCKVDPATPSTAPSVIEVVERVAKGPSPCADVLKDPNYKNVVGLPPQTWSDGIRNTGIVILGKATGIPTLQGWKNDEIYAALTMDCSNMTQDPNFARLYSMPPDKWTDGDRNTAIVIIGKASKILASRLQGLRNVDLSNFLQGKRISR